MAAWTVAAVTTTVFMSIYDSEDFRERLNMKIAPTLEYKLILVCIMVANFLICYIWEVFFLDGVLFAKVLPWYKDHIRGPHLPFEHLGIFSHKMSKITNFGHKHSKLKFHQKIQYF